MKQTHIRYLLLTFLFLAGNLAGARTDSETKTGTSPGNKAPEIIGKKADGTKLSLSSLRGKLVLVDFWASWCPPCRRENPHVVTAYREFRDKQFKNGNGFTVFGVSLDKEKGAWEKAIEEDQLVWANHVSDLKGWISPHARVYGIRSIPSNFLIDGDGIIVDVNLRGKKLEQTLRQLLK